MIWLSGRLEVVSLNIFNKPWLPPVVPQRLPYPLLPGVEVGGKEVDGLAGGEGRDDVADEVVAEQVEADVDEEGQGREEVVQKLNRVWVLDVALKEALEIGSILSRE